MLRDLKVCSMCRFLLLIVYEPTLRPTGLTSWNRVWCNPLSTLPPVYRARIVQRQRPYISGKKLGLRWPDVSVSQKDLHRKRVYHDSDIATGMIHGAFSSSSSSSFNFICNPETGMARISWTVNTLTGRGQTNPHLYSSEQASRFYMVDLYHSVPRYLHYD